jgi:predicted cupin superfamily sugar epimerase
MKTAIYYLLAGDELSRLHRVRSEEIRHLLDEFPNTPS